MPSLALLEANKNVSLNHLLHQYASNAVNEVRKSSQNPLSSQESIRKKEMYHAQPEMRMDDLLLNHGQGYQKTASFYPSALVQ